jgi:hypothetical protein
VRVFKNVRFARFDRKQNIPDETLMDAIERAEGGQIDASLGGGVIKQRIARTGQGKRGGYRTIILYRNAERAFFVYGFAKNEQANINEAEATALKTLAANVLNLSGKLLRELLDQGIYTEVSKNDSHDVQK